MIEKNAWDKLKLFINIKATTAKNGTVASFHLHLENTIEYLDALHPPTSCDMEGACTVVFIAHHLEALNTLTNDTDIVLEILTLTQYIDALIESETKKLEGRANEMIREMFGDTSPNPIEDLMKEVFKGMKK